MLIRIRNKSIKFHVKVLRTLLDWTTIPFQRLYEVLLNTWWANIFCNLELLFLFKRKYIYLWKLWLKVSSHDVGVTPKGRAIQRAHVTRHDREGVFHWFNIKKIIEIKIGSFFFILILFIFIKHTNDLVCCKKTETLWFYLHIKFQCYVWILPMYIWIHTHPSADIFSYHFICPERKISEKHVFFFQENKAIDW